VLGITPHFPPPPPHQLRETALLVDHVCQLLQIDCVPQDPFTLIVALDQGGSAVGSLYLDDGCSYAYEQGSFGKSVMTFQKGVLSNKVAPQITEGEGEAVSRLQRRCLI